MKRMRNSLAAGAVLVSTAMLAAGCSTGPSSDNSDGDVTLTFFHITNDTPRWKEAIAAFEKEHKNVTVKEQAVSFDDLTTQMQARLSAKDSSLDVLLVDGPRVAALAAQGFLADLSSYKSEIEQQTSKTALGAMTYDGKQWAFPQWTSTNVLYYNKDLLAAANLENPDPSPENPMTWAEVVDSATKAQDAGSKYGFAFEQIDRYYQLQPLFESAGGGSGLTGEHNLTPAVTTPEWIKTAKWYANLFSSGLAPRGIPVNQMTDQFTSGNVAYFVGGPWITPALKASDIDWGVAQFPYFADGKPVTPTGSWTVAVSAFSKHTKEAEAFAKFITLDPEGASLSFPEGPAIQKDALDGYLATLTSNGGVDADLAKIIKYDEANTGVARPATVGYVDFENIMNKAFADLRNGQDVEKTLQNASDQLKTKFARFK